MQRLFFTVRQSIKFRSQLQACQVLPNLLALDLPFLQKSGVQTLILDFDGVLNSHAEDTVVPELFSWLTSCSRLFKVYILSNKPTATRQVYFAQNFPQITFVHALAKKPYPAGILQIQQLSASIGHKILLVDDRLLTGILAGCLMDIRVVLVRSPLVNFKRRPVREAFFLALRVFERLYLRLALDDVCGTRKLHSV